MATITNFFKKTQIVTGYFIRFGIVKGWAIFRGARSKAPRLLLPGYANAVTLRSGTTDIEVFEQIFLKEEYKFSAKASHDNIRYILDCGANTGLSAIYFHRLCPQAKIVAVELEKSNYQVLAQNVAGIPEITAVHAGVWSNNVMLVTADSNADNWGFQATEASVTGDNTVEGVTIAALMQRYHFPRIDILKIDIESGELELFAENSETFLPKVRYILIEFHDWIKPNTGRTFFKAVSGYNYRVFPRGENIFCELLHPQPLHITYPDM